MENKTEQKFNKGDVVQMNNSLYKIIHIYENGHLKLRSIRGKTSEILFNVPLEFVSKRD